MRQLKQCDTTFVELPRGLVLSALILLLTEREKRFNEEEEHFLNKYLRTTESYGFLWLRNRRVTPEMARINAKMRLADWEYSRIKWHRDRKTKIENLIDLIKASGASTVSMGAQDFEDIKKFYKAST